MTDDLSKCCRRGAERTLVIYATADRDLVAIGLFTERCASFAGVAASVLFVRHAG